MATDKPALSVKDFDGIVITMDWIRMPDSRQYTGFAGKVTALSAKEAVGWEPTGHNSANWLVRVAGPTSSINLMGCQVRLVIEGSAAHTESADIYRVP
jgi:hypothetical protein